ncbi:MAG: ROK family protein [Clostridiales bacterium]|jgi:predicted NBD/HSP70 family sugar kinase|nr:ROK family protein [Clostridiales bacterium]
MSSFGMGRTRKGNTRNRILGLIRRAGKISKQDIKKTTQYSMVTVLTAIDDLLEQGLVFYSEKGVTSSGRRPTYISLNPEGGFFLGLSFNAAEASAVIIDYCGGVRDFAALPFSPDNLSVEYALTKSSELIRGMLQRNEDKKDRLIGIGIGAPGYLDDRGTSIFYSHIPGWQNVDLKDFFSDALDCGNIFIEQNTNSMALAYKWLKPEYMEKNYAIINISTGIRMSFVVNGMLYKGKSFIAGEIGHIRANRGSRFCPCGRQGCLDTEISETAIRLRMLEGIRGGRFASVWKAAGENANLLEIASFIQGAKEFDPDCIALLDDICDHLGDALTQIVNILNPESIIITARLCELGDAFFDRIKKNINERAIFVALDNFEIIPDSFGKRLAAIGAAAVVMENELDYVDALI